MKFFESLEPRRLFSGDALPAEVPMIHVRAKMAAAYENGPVTRFFYIRRSGDTSQPLVVNYIVGGKAHQGVDYNLVGQAVTIKAGTHLRRIEVTPISDGFDENNESVTLTLLGGGYTIDPMDPAATIRIISDEDTPPPPPPPPPTPAPTSITWSTQAAAPIVRAEALRAVIDNRLYVFGGFSGTAGPIKRSDVYDPATNTWTQIADLPTRLTHAGVAVDGRNVYVAGGYVGIGSTGYSQTFGTRDVWRYNVDSNSWSPVVQLPRALASGGLAVVGRELHYFGGNDSNRNDAGDHYALNLDDQGSGWQPREMMPDARSHLGYVSLDGKIWAIGGQYGNDDALETTTTVSEYDPAADAWTNRPPLPVAISHIASAAFVLDGRIVIAGGETDHNVATNRVTIFDPATNEWKSLTNLPAARFSGVAAAIGGNIYFTGGSSQTTTWKGIPS